MKEKIVIKIRVLIKACLAFTLYFYIDFRENLTAISSILSAFSTGRSKRRTKTLLGNTFYVKALIETCTGVSAISSLIHDN